VVNASETVQPETFMKSKGRLNLSGRVFGVCVAYMGALKTLFSKDYYLSVLFRVDIISRKYLIILISAMELPAASRRLFRITNKMINYEAAIDRFVYI
jgi:hypothetical protein